MFSPDDKTIFVSTTENYFELDALTGNIIREIPGIRGAKYFSADGRYSYTYDLKKVDMISGETIGEFKSSLLPWYFYDFDVNENAKKYVCIIKHGNQMIPPDSTIGVFDSETFELLKIFGPEYHYMEKVSISPDGKFIATNSLYDPSMEIKGDEVYRTIIWDGENYQQIKQLQMGGSSMLKFSPDDNYLGVGDGSYIYLYDTKTWELVDTFKTVDYANIISFAFSFFLKFY